jgi:hypothetical protein
MSDWETMESAPRDGTAVWLWCDGAAYLGYGEPANPLRERDECWYLKATVRRNPHHCDGERDEIVGTYVHDAEPTLWMPLPAPPSPSQQGAASETN